LRCINRLHDSSSGQILFHHPDFDGGVCDIAQVDKNDIMSVRKKIAMIFQHFNLVPRHSVLSNVLTGALGRTAVWRSIFGIYSKPDREMAMKFLKLVGIDEKAYMRATQLSGGQQQRVAIARALTQMPDILLADEPVASLDPATCHVVMDYLRKVNRELGLTVVCNLHFLSLVREYATRVIALKNGEVVYEGSPKEINDQWFEKIYGEGAREVHIN
jgi:phosphonate transport system ATP-binding protein